MPKKLLGEEIVRLRQALQGQSYERQEDLEALVNDLELRLKTPEAGDPAYLLSALQGWSVQMENNHPVASAVLNNIVRALGSMGV